MPRNKNKIDPDGLLPKQRKFCQEYIFDWNINRAARAAGYASSSATNAGKYILTIPSAQEYIKTLQADLEKFAGVSQLRNLAELAKIAYSSLGALHNTWIDLKQFESLTPEQKAAIESIDTKEVVKKNRAGEVVSVDRMVKIKLYNKLAAIESLNRMLGYNAPTKNDLTSNGAAVQMTQPLTPAQIKAIIEKL